MTIEYQKKTCSLPEIAELEKSRSLVPCLLDKYNHTLIDIQIPDADLTGMTTIQVRGPEDIIHAVPSNTSGCYWIMTDEPVNHCFNNGAWVPKKRNCDGLSIVYSGVCDNLRSRLKEHLLRPDGVRCNSGSRSAMSIDVLPQDNLVKTHVKCAWAEKKKLPKILTLSPTGGGAGDVTYKKPESYEEICDALRIETTTTTTTITTRELYFKNGIDVRQPKHASYQWKVAFVPLKVHCIRDYVENEWKKRHGCPVLCSYKEGR